MSTQNQQTPVTRPARPLDIRNFIGILLGLYGIILTVMGLFGDTEALAGPFHQARFCPTGGINANLWAGIFLLIGSAIFLGWAKLRPVTVLHHIDGDEAPRPGH